MAAVTKSALIDAKGLAEYERVRDAAWTEYERVQGPAWAEYERVRVAAKASARIATSNRANAAAVSA